MFDIKICDIHTAPVIINEWATKVVSLIDERPTSGFFSSPCNDGHRILAFHDIDTPLPDYVHPTAEHLEEILAFTATFTPQDRVLVHCHAGISRSTATAIAILMQHGMSWRNAFKAIEKVRPILWPNGLIVRLTDDKFQLGGEYARFVRQWKIDETENRVLIKPPSATDVSEMKRFMDLFPDC